MPDRFVAIDVHQGDAFYLELNSPENFRVLVDGGRNTTTQFHHQFQQALPGVPGVDVMVCTHWDDDHVQGLRDFLSNGLTTRELWVPDDWYDKIGTYLLDPARCIHQVMDEIEHIRSDDMEELQERFDQGGLSHLQHYSEWLLEQEPQNAEAREGSGGEETRTAKVAESLWDGNTLFPTWILEESYLYPETYILLNTSWRDMETPRTHLLLDVLHFLKGATNLVKEALNLGVLVRWFAFDPVHPRGPDPRLKPLNCREVRQTQSALPASAGTPGQSMLRALSLTVANQRSLVFYAPGTETRPHVLFSGDSNFDFLVGYQHRFPWKSGMLITTPHHGATSNWRLAQEHNQQVAQQQIRDTVWVRSDTQKTTRPDPWYTTLQSAIRYCTRCRPKVPFLPFPAQTIRLVAANGRWAPATGIGLRVCTC